jgi:hypothetical protein
MKQNCKIKDSSLSFELKTAELTKINKLGRALVNTKQWFKRLVNMPDRTRIVRVSNHLGTAGKKDLEKSILTEIRTYKNKQTIRVKTDINNRCLKPL